MNTKERLKTALNDLNAIADAMPYENADADLNTVCGFLYQWLEELENTKKQERLPGWASELGFEPIDLTEGLPDLTEALRKDLGE